MPVMSGDVFWEKKKKRLTVHSLLVVSHYFIL